MPGVDTKLFASTYRKAKTFGFMSVEGTLDTDQTADN